eukprot:COSAG05_NODE_22543_length_264_cov_0.624242_1_plen_71_part_10
MIATRNRIGTIEFSSPTVEVQFLRGAVHFFLASKEGFVKWHCRVANRQSIANISGVRARQFTLAVCVPPRV